MKDPHNTILTHRVTINFSATDECETCVNKIFVDKQKEKVESMETIALPVTQFATTVSTA